MNVRNVHLSVVFHGPLVLMHLNRFRARSSHLINSVTDNKRSAVDTMNMLTADKSTAKQKLQSSVKQMFSSYLCVVSCNSRAVCARVTL